MLVVSLFLACQKNEEQDPQPAFVWKQIGLSGLKVNRLELAGNMLYAITNDGLYVKNIGSEGEFESLGLRGKNLLDIVVFDANHMLASYRNSSDWQETEIYETKDRGATWVVKVHDFGLQSTEPVTDFFWDKSKDILYATGLGVMAQSTDRGTTWRTLWGAWGNLGTGMIVEMNPEKTDELWFGGQGAIENGYLVQFNEGKLSKEWSDLVPNPTVPKKIVFDKQVPQNIYTGWEGELKKTSDSGNTWKTLIERHEESHFFFGIGISELDPNMILAGKWEKGVDRQPLTLYYSKDGGQNWKENTHAGESEGGVFDLKIRSSELNERIFLALDKGGVYEVTVDRNKL